jgi:hypothetical protein
MSLSLMSHFEKDSFNFTPTIKKQNERNEK